jgi:hypothetical protein
MYFPIAGVTVNPWLLILIGFTVGVCSGFFGGGGAFIVTPALNILGFPMAYAIGTDLAHIMGKSVIAVAAHRRLGNVDIKAGLIIIAGILPGIEIGARAVMWLENKGLTGPVVRWAYIFVLLLIGTFMLREYLAVRRCLAQCGYEKAKVQDRLKQRSIAIKVQAIKLRPLIRLPVAGIEQVSLWVLLGIGLITGFLAGFLGVGGGFVRVPAFIYLIGMPTATAVGTDLLGIFFSGTFGSLTYALKGRVDLLAALIMLIGSAVGSQLGALATSYVRGFGIRLSFALTIFISALAIALKQAGLTLLSGIVLIGMATIMSIVIITVLIVRIYAERKAEISTG